MAAPRGTARSGRRIESSLRSQPVSPEGHVCARAESSSCERKQWVGLWLVAHEYATVKSACESPGPLDKQLRRGLKLGRQDQPVYTCGIKVNECPHQDG